MAQSRIAASCATVIVTVIVLVLTLSMPVNPSAAQSSGWWGCPNGYEFEVESDKSRVRCIKREDIRFRAVSCPAIGQATDGPAPRIAQDRNGVNDACIVGDSPYTATPVCPRGYTSETRSGLDRCVIRVPSVIRPPIQQ